MLNLEFTSNNVNYASVSRKVLIQLNNVLRGFSVSSFGFSTRIYDVKSWKMLFFCGAGTGQHNDDQTLYEVCSF